MNHNKGIAQALVPLGESYSLLDKHDEALGCFVESTRIIIAHDYDMLLDVACAGMAQVYYKTGEYDKAYELSLYIDRDQLYPEKRKQLKMINTNAAKKLSKKKITVFNNKAKRKKLKDIAAEYCGA